MIQIELPDGSVTDFPDGSSALDVAASIGERLAMSTVAAEVNGTVGDATRPIEMENNEPVQLKLITTRDPQALGVMRHSAAHVMARAVMRLFDGVSLAFGS